MESLPDNVARLSEYLTQMRENRYSTPLANDIYEAVWYWRDIGKWILERNTEVNYPARALEERALLERLAEKLQTQSPSEQVRYAPVFEAAHEVLRTVAATVPPKDGHLGILCIIRSHFGFLETEYALSVADEQPTGMKYSSDDVWIELGYAERSSQCCTFGPETESRSVFWPEDLLFLFNDIGYREVQQERLLLNVADLEAWFEALAEIWRKYGRDVLTYQPGVFERLAVAQALHGAELKASMNAQYGQE